MKAVCLIVSLVWLNADTIGASECNYTSDANYFTCTDRGLFPNYNDKTCTQYYSCMKHSTGYYQILKTCSNGTYFNRDTNKCDWFYQCPCAGSQSPNFQVSSDIGSEQQAMCVDDATATFDCEDSAVMESGCYPDPSSPFCDKYIYCYVARSGSGQRYQKQVTCAAGTFFDASENVCGCSVAAGFTCPCKRG